MGEVVARIYRSQSALYREARQKVWVRLTPREQNLVREIEADQELLALFDSLERDYRQFRNFVLPKGLSPFEEEALRAMHRFADELAHVLADGYQDAVFIDLYRRQKAILKTLAR